MGAPKVSVIVPCYNLGRYLGEALDSVLAQTFPDWECIVVNDGSSDKTDAVASSFVEKDSRFRLLALENGGVARARNEGAAISRGTYLLFLDADDMLMPWCLAESVPILEGNPEAKAVCGKAECFGKGIRTKELERPAFSMEAMLAHNCIYICSLLRRVDFDRSGGFSSDFAGGLEDWDFWLGILEEGGEVVTPDRIMFRYRMRRRSRNRLVSDDRLRAIRRLIWNRHKDMYAKYFMDPTDTMEYRRLLYHYEKYSRFPGICLYRGVTRIFHRLFS